MVNHVIADIRRLVAGERRLDVQGHAGDRADVQVVVADLADGTMPAAHAAGLLSQQRRDVDLDPNSQILPAFADQAAQVPEGHRRYLARIARHDVTTSTAEYSS